MKVIETLKRKIDVLNEQDYGRYQSLKGEYEYANFRLFIDQIPKDPYAPPHTGLYRVVLKNTFITEFDKIFHSKVSQIAFCDFLARRFYAVAFGLSKARRGTGNSGLITIEKPGQAILERNAVIVDRDEIEVRFFIGLPAEGRLITAGICNEMLRTELPAIVTQALLAENNDMEKLDQHIKIAEDAEAIRSKLNAMNLVAFIANGSILPRKSGTSDEPLDQEEAIAFESPRSLMTEIELPHGGKIQGMGIPKGISLIVGGGYHGKTTLLNAIEMGIYNHIPGDGREKCISEYSATKMRAYSGRSIEKVDISLFVDNLPLQKDTVRFSTENASGSTSQAASIVEAMEAGVNVLLMDEDTCATNFLVRDQKMQKLVLKEDEPITTFIDRVEDLYIQNGISTVLVLGGIGDYFEVSDTVIQMKNYQPLDVTVQARAISVLAFEKRLREGKSHQRDWVERVLATGCIDPHNNYGKKSVYAKDISQLHFGKTVIDLTDVEQLVELTQTKTLGAALCALANYADGKRSLMEVIQRVMEEIQLNGLDVLSDKKTGHFAQFRAIDLACAINRLRGIKMI